MVVLSRISAIVSSGTISTVIYSDARPDSVAFRMDAKARVISTSTHYLQIPAAATIIYEVSMADIGRSTTYGCLTKL